MWRAQERTGVHGAGVVIAEPIAAAAVETLRARGAHPVDVIGRGRESLVASLRDADALVVRSETPIDASLLASAARLRVIARAGVGVDSIDVEAATREGILVLNTPGANTIAAAEHTFALMLALVRHIPEALALLRASRWERGPFVGSEMYHKTLGIIGLGRVGSAVARRARAFGMRVLAYDPYLKPHVAAAAGADLVTLPELFALSDIVSLHAPLSSETRRLIDRTRLAAFRPGAVLVNCARGALIDEQAVLEALESGRLGGVGLDVFEVEPPAFGDATQALLAHPRCIATPHLGGSTHEALARVGRMIADDVVCALEGSIPASAVNGGLLAGP